MLLTKNYVEPNVKSNSNNSNSADNV